jgi:hypothetical protein
MTKQETAEFMAEKVLKLPILLCDASPALCYREDDRGDRQFTNLQGYIYSLDGFSAVWHDLQERLGYGLGLEFNVGTDGRCTCYIHKRIEQFEYAGNGKDLYEAFYNAVMMVITSIFTWDDSGDVTCN